MKLDRTITRIGLFGVSKDEVTPKVLRKAFNPLDA